MPTKTFQRHFRTDHVTVLLWHDIPGVSPMPGLNQYTPGLYHISGSGNRAQPLLAGFVRVIQVWQDPRAPVIGEV
jgi:hypothetical protein